MAGALLLLILTLTPSVSLGQDVLKELVNPGDDASSEATGDKSAGIEWLPDKLQVPSGAEAGTGIWRSFFDRDPIGFSLDTFDDLKDDLTALDEIVAVWLSDVEADPAATLARSLLPLWIFMILVVLQVYVSMRLRSLGPAINQRLEANAPPWLRRVVAVLLPIVLLMLAPVVLLFLVHLGSGLVPERYGVWTVIFKGFYLYLVVYRAMLGAIRGVFGTAAVVDPGKVRRLQKLATSSLRLVFVFQLAAFLVEATGYRGGANGEIYALVLFGMKVSLGVIALRLFVVKAEVVGLLTRFSESRIGQRLHRGVDRYYGWVTGISIVLIFLWSVGYTNAAGLLLTRGYSILGVLAVAAAVDRQVRIWFSRRVEAQMSRSVSLRRFERVAGGLVALTTLYTVLTILGLEEIILTLLRYPLFRLGSAQLSIYAVAKALFIFGVFVLIAKGLKPFLNQRIYPRFGIDIGVGYAITTVATYVLYVLGTLTAVVALGVDLGAVTVLFGALGVGIGFGLQDITRNLISGFILLFGRSVKKGDLVRVNDFTGRVEAMGARAVHLITPDNYEIVIPSSALVSEPIVNFTYSSPIVRVHIPAGVHYDSDVRQAERALHAAAQRHPDVLADPPVEVWLKEFGDNSINFDLLVWIDVTQTVPERVTGELNFHIWDVLSEQGLEIPYPQTDLHIKGSPAVEDLVRAVRHEDRRTEDPPPPRPPLPDPPAHASRRRVAFHAPDSTVESEIFRSLRSIKDPARRAHLVARAVESFFTSRLASLEEAARHIALHMEEQDEFEQPGDGPIDTLLTPGHEPDEASLTPHGA